MKKNLASFLKFPVYEKLGNAISLPPPHFDLLSFLWFIQIVWRSNVIRQYMGG